MTPRPPTGPRLQRPADLKKRTKKLLPRSQYQAALKRREGPARERFRKRYMPSKGKKRRPVEKGLIDPRTMKDVRREAAAAGELEFGPATRQKQAELRGSQEFAAQRLPSFYEQYRQDVAAASARAQEAYAAAQQQSQAAETGVREQYGQEQARRAGEAQEIGRVTGTAPQAPPEASQAALSRTKAQDAFSALLGARKGEEASFYGQLGAAGSKRHIESQEAERKRQRNIGTELQDIQTRRGAYGTEFVRKARGEERQFAAEAKAFELDVAQEKSKQSKEAFDRRAKRRELALKKQKGGREARKLQSDLADARTDRAKKRAATAIDAYNLAHPNNPISKRGGSKGGRTPSQIRSDREKHNKASSDVASTVDAHPEMRQKTLAGKKARITAIRKLKSKYGFSDKKAASIVKKVVGF